MKPEIKGELVRRLRSGEYTQVRGRLRGDAPNCYCIAGILVQMYAETHPGFQWERVIGDALIPTEVKDWAECKYELAYHPGTEVSLMDLNDAGMSFRELADELEEWG